MSTTKQLEVEGMLCMKCGKPIEAFRPFVPVMVWVEEQVSMGVTGPDGWPRKRSVPMASIAAGLHVDCEVPE